MNECLAPQSKFWPRLPPWWFGFVSRGREPDLPQCSFAPQIVAAKLNKLRHKAKSARRVPSLCNSGSVAEFVGDKTQGGGLTAPQRGRRGHSPRLRQSGLGFPWVGVAKGGPGQNRTLCLPGPINPCPA